MYQFHFQLKDNKERHFDAAGIPTVMFLCQSSTGYLWCYIFNSIIFPQITLDRKMTRSENLFTYRMGTDVINRRDSAKYWTKMQRTTFMSWRQNTAPWCTTQWPLWQLVSLCLLTACQTYRMITAVSKSVNTNQVLGHALEGS